MIVQPWFVILERFAKTPTVIPSEVEGLRCEIFEVTSAGSLDFARDDVHSRAISVRAIPAHANRRAARQSYSCRMTSQTSADIAVGRYRFSNRATRKIRQ